MPPTPNQILEQLLKAIDQDAKVINMVGVLEAISCIENIRITKEELEETRLGKIVNDIRKNTTDKLLSARCKKLVRVWSKQFVTGSTARPPQDATASRQSTPPTRGPPPSASGRASAHLQTTPSTASTSTVDRNKSENRKRRKSVHSPSGTCTGSTTSKRPRPTTADRTPTTNATKEQTIGVDVKNGMPVRKTPSPSNLAASRSALPAAKLLTESASERRTSLPLPKGKERSPSPASRIKKPNSTNQVLQKSSVVKQVPSPVSRTGSKRSPVSSGTSKADNLPSTIAEQASNNFNTADCKRQDQADGYIDERRGGDDALVSRLLPQGNLPDGGEILQDPNSSSANVKLRSPLSVNCKIEINVTGPAVVCERVRAESESLGVEEAGPSSFSIFDDDYESEEEEQPCAAVEQQPVEPSTQSVLPLSTDSRELSRENSEGDEVVPMEDSSFQGGAISSEVGDDDTTLRQPVTEEDIARLHGDRWDGVNGCYGNRTEWYDWTASLSVPVQDDALHILPYVCLD